MLFVKRTLCLMVVVFVLFVIFDFKPAKAVYKICDYSPQKFAIQGDIMTTSNGPVDGDVTVTLNNASEIVKRSSTKGSDVPIAITFMIDTDYTANVSSYTLSVSASGYNKYSQTYQIPSCDYDGIKSVSVRLEAQQVANSATPSSITKKTTTSTTVATPAAPTLALTSTAKVTTIGTSQTLDSGTTPSIISTQKLTFAGTATANAKVTLTIKSDPIVKEVTADVIGAWTYTLDPKELALETGSHTVSAYATDTKGVKSAEIELAKFELKDAPAPIAAATTDSKLSYKDFLNIKSYILLFGALVLIGVLIMMIVKRRKLGQIGNGTAI